MSKNVKEIQDQETQLLGGFPNTYTYTKNMAEKRLAKTLGKVKCVIWRPAIIASAAE